MLEIGRLASSPSSFQLLIGQKIGRQVALLGRGRRLLRWWQWWWCWWWYSPQEGGVRVSVSNSIQWCIPNNQRHAIILSGTEIGEHLPLVIELAIGHLTEPQVEPDVPIRPLLPINSSTCNTYECLHHSYCYADQNAVDSHVLRPCLVRYWKCLEISWKIGNIITATASSHGNRHLPEKGSVLLVPMQMAFTSGWLVASWARACLMVPENLNTFSLWLFMLALLSQDGQVR